MDAGSSSNEPEYKPPVIVWKAPVSFQREFIQAEILKYHKKMAKSKNKSFDEDIAKIWPGVTATVESDFGDHTGKGVVFAEVYFELKHCGRMAYQIIKPGQKLGWYEPVPPNY